MRTPHLTPPVYRTYSTELARSKGRFLSSSAATSRLSGSTRLNCRSARRLMEGADDPNRGAAFEEGIKHQRYAGLNLQVRSLRHDARDIPYETDRQRQGQLAALRLGQEARGKPAADRVQLKF